MQDQQTPMAYTIAYLRRVEPNLKGVARETTGGITCTEWGRSPAIQAALENVKPRRHEKWCEDIVSAAWRHMEENREAWYVNAERVMASPEWDQAPESVRQEFLLRTAQATDPGKIGGRRIIGAHRPSAVAVNEVFGGSFIHRTASNAADRVHDLGWLKRIRGQGYATGKQSRSTAFELPEAASCTSPPAAKTSCASEEWKARMAPLFRRLRAAFAGACGWIKSLKRDMPAGLWHMPPEMYLRREPEFDHESVWSQMDDLDEGLSPPGYVRQAA